MDVKLTPKQQEVLGYLQQGKSNAAIAKAMGVKLETIKLHVSTLLEIYHVDSRLKLVLKSLDHKIAA